ncbi:MAG: hypothetical protein WCI55_03310 [Armatimonadota bacterium]
MRYLLALVVIILGITAVGCSGDSSTEGVPKVEGKVEVTNMPEGTSAPGDKRTTPADTGATRESDSRG